MKVIIPLAGKGTRLRPHTHLTPKPMLKVAGKPVISYLLDDLKSLGGIEQIAGARELGRERVRHLSPLAPGQLAEVGGDALVGKAKELDPGLFYYPGTSE